MVIDGILEILDIDQHLTKDFQRIHAKGLEICKEYGAVLDLAASDVVIFVKADSLEVAEKVSAAYETAHQVKEITPPCDGNWGLYCIG